MPSTRIMMHQPAGIAAAGVHVVKHLTLLLRNKLICLPSPDLFVWCPLTCLSGTGGAMGSADEVNIQASELNRTMKVFVDCLLGMLSPSAVLCKLEFSLSVSSLRCSCWTKHVYYALATKQQWGAACAGHQQIPQQIYRHDYRWNRGRDWPW